MTSAMQPCVNLFDVNVCVGFCVIDKMSIVFARAGIGVWPTTTTQMTA